MAIDKAIDSTEFDSKLTTVADAIRTAGGTTEPMSFPSGMVEAISVLKSGSEAGGGAGFATGTLTFNESQHTHSNLTVTHNLGFAPEHILWFIIETEAKSSDTFTFQAGNYPISFEYISKEAYVVTSNPYYNVTNSLEYSLETSGGYLDLIDFANSNEETIDLFFKYAYRYSCNIPASSTIRWLVW